MIADKFNTLAKCIVALRTLKFKTHDVIVRRYVDQRLGTIFGEEVLGIYH